MEETKKELTRMQKIKKTKAKNRMEEQRDLKYGANEHIRHDTR